MLKAAISIMTISPLHDFLFHGIIPQRRPFMKKNEKNRRTCKKAAAP